MATCPKRWSASDQLIEVRAGFSVRHLLLFLLLLSLAFLAIWLSGIVFLIKITLSILLAASGHYYYQLYIQKNHARSVTALRYHQGIWHAHYNKSWHRVWLTGERLVLPELISLAFVEEKSRRPLNVNLFSDSDTAESIHALRLRLLLEREQKRGHPKVTSYRE